MAKIVPLASIAAAEYNPRVRDEERIKLLTLSLSKLGFLLPVYISDTGEILSGHQRCYVAKRLGFKSVPVEVVTGKSLEERKVLNILFNRATNDSKRDDLGSGMKETLKKKDLTEEADEIKTIQPDTEEAYPCIYSVKRKDTKRLAEINCEEFDEYIKGRAKDLKKSIGKPMLTVITESGKIVNGIGRLQMAVEAGEKVIECVVIPDEKAALAKNLLNLLSMDFDIKTAHADMLRYNSFMRPRNTRQVDKNTGLCAFGDGFFKGLFPKATGLDFCELRGAALLSWKKKYGESIVDFGAGKLNNTRTLRAAGISVSAFEPYFAGTGETINKKISLEIDRKFLEEISDGRKFSSVFISSVYNSVPFIEDRIEIAKIAGALCGNDGMVVCWCQSDKYGGFVKRRKGKDSVLGRTARGFLLDYEPNVTMGDYVKHPKVQKGHTEEELRHIFTEAGFKEIRRVSHIGGFLYLEAAKPVIDIGQLKKAIEFEFELPYPDGTTMGLSQMAKEAFGKRLGVNFDDR